MKNSINKSKAHALKQRAAALISAALLMSALIFTACVQQEPTPKYIITFGVDGMGGRLTATVDGSAIRSGEEVEQGKTVTFTAEAELDSYLKGWTLNGAPVNGTAKTYTLTVTKAADVKVKIFPEAAVLTLGDKKDITITAKTADGSAVQVEGCSQTTLASDEATTLNAKGTKVNLKGKITELIVHCELTALNVQGLTALEVLDCDENQLTELGVQGLKKLKKLYCAQNQLTGINLQGLTSLERFDCWLNKIPALNLQGLTALSSVDCHLNQLTSIKVQSLTALQFLTLHGNKLSAEVLTELFNALPQREQNDKGKCTLYIEREQDGTHKDFNNPAELKTAFDAAKKRNWQIYKRTAKDDSVEL